MSVAGSFQGLNDIAAIGELLLYRSKLAAKRGQALREFLAAETPRTRRRMPPCPSPRSSSPTATGSFRLS
jgi:hypothetical protein